MKIGFDAKRAFQNRSGLGNYSRSTISLLNKYYPENNYYLFSPSINNDLFEIPAQQSNYHVIEPQKNTPKILKPLWRSFGITNIINSNKLDIYHGLSHELPLNSKKIKAKTVVTMHDLIFVRFPHLYKATDRWLYTAKYKRSCQLANKIIAISQQTADDLVEYFKVEKDKIEVVYQTCHSIYTQPVSKEQLNNIKIKYNLPSEYLLFVGTVEERKNVLSIVKALKNIALDIPLVVVGRQTPYVEKIKKYISENNIKQKIIFLNQIFQNELPAIYQMASIFVYPSIFEGFGIPILESLFCKTPVITSTGSCFAETGGKSSIYVNPQDSEQLADAVQKVLNDSQLRELMKSEGYKYAMNFTEDKVAANLMRVYSNLIAQ